MSATTTVVILNPEPVASVDVSAFATVPGAVARSSVAEVSGVGVAVSSVACTPLPSVSAVGCIGVSVSLIISCGAGSITLSSTRSVVSAAVASMVYAPGSNLVVFTSTVQTPSVPH